MSDVTRIKDIPKFQKMLRDSDAMVKSLPILRVLRFFGMKIDNLDALSSQARELKAAAESLINLPDRFNDMFAMRGWIAYELLNVDVMVQTIVLAESTNIDEAEKFLADYYDESTLSFNLMAMNAVKAFWPRRDLALKAKEDYIEGRYYAIVPLVLSLLDGFVNDVGKGKGFFAEGVNLEAWDSISAHSKGLGELTKILRTTRKKTSTETLTIPYRHGILHGRDLGYDNKVVAAKCWAALFAVRDWALAIETGRTPKPEDKPPSWREIFKSITSLSEEKQRLETWTPRSNALISSIPTSANPDEYNPGSPEHLVATFLDYWHRRNYGGMATCLPEAYRGKLSKAAGEAREMYGVKELVSFEFKQIKDEAPAITEITAQIVYKEDEEQKQAWLHCRLIFQDANGDLLARGNPEGSWSFWPKLEENDA